MKNKIILGDCLEVMKNIPDKSIDMILCDLPYKKSMGDWDSVVDLSALWIQYRRIILNQRAIALFGQNPFSAKLIVSNLSMYKYNWIWDKGKAGNIFTAKLCPMIIHEDVLIFSDGNIANGSSNNMSYFPIMEKLDSPRKYSMASSGKSFERDSHKKIKYTKTHNYPKSTIYFYNSNIRGKLHPTQKPVELCEYLIKTYTKEGDTVLDNCIGSGTTAVACINTGRNFIGIEKDEKYWKIANDRIANHTKQLKIFDF